MRRPLGSIAALSLALPILAAGDPAKDGRVVVETVLAKVNDEVITQMSFERSFAPLYHQLQDKYKDKPAELVKEIESKKRVFLDQMIDNVLLTLKAKADGIKVGEDEVREVCNRIMSENAIKSEEEFILALKSEGLDYQDFKADMRSQGYREKLIQKEILQKLVVSDGEVQAYYDEHPDRFVVPARTRVREIGLGSDRVDADKLLARVQAALKGASFADVAKEMSLAPSREHGGDLGWFSEGDLDPAIEEAVKRLKPGETSGLVGSSYGFRIVKVEERQEAGKRPLSEVKESVEDFLRGKKYDEDLKALVGKLREEADIRYKDENGTLVAAKDARGPRS